MSRRTTEKLGLAAVAAALLLACELAVKTSGLSGGKAAGSEPDGSVPGTLPDGAAADATTEGGATDAGTSLEAGRTGTCAGLHPYCNSFETDAELVDWFAEGLTVALDPVDARAGAFAAHLTPTSLPAAGIWSYKAPPTLPRPHAFFRVLVKTPLGGTVMTYGTPNYSDAIQAYVGGDFAYHFEQYSGKGVFTNIHPDLTAWHCVELEVDETAKRANAWFDDAGPFTIELVAPDFPYLRLALVVSNGDGRFDDFAFDTKRIGCP